ncbi:hypothetical protein ACT3CE_03920 [Marinifilum sp. RC60d5]|uniref:hypothetical protein n=1 Tax=Marinifilum sp. RC60d5 TaxID=3458414 RepID=UPI0040369596
MISLLILLNLFLPIQNKILINNKHSSFEVDKLGFIYTVSNSKLTKYDSKGNEICNYSNQLLGEISSVDVSDPLRIMLFYKDFNKLIYLNSKLSLIGNDIDLYDFSDTESELVCNSQKGGFWLYNSIDNQIIKISQTGSIVSESILISSFFEDIPLSKIKEYNGKLFLLFKSKGILHLDQNGQFLRKISIPGIQEIYLQKNEIYYSTKSGLFHYSPLLQKNPPLITFDANKKNNLKISGNKIFLSNEKSISIRSLSF